MTLHIRSAKTIAPSVNLSDRTVEAIVSTGAAVIRQGFTERLELSGVDLSRLIGAPVLDAHKTTSTQDQFGVVEAAEVRSEGLWVSMRFRSTEAALAALSDISEGTLRGLSIGYSVAEWKTETIGKQRHRIAVRWTPIEVSLVPVPADAGAHFRSGDNQMPETQNETIEMTRGEVNAQIRNIAVTAGLTRAWADQMIDEEADLDQVRADALEAMQKRSQSQSTRSSRATIGFDNTDPAVIATRAGEALFARSHPDHDLSDAAREFAHMSFVDISRDCLRRSGVGTTGMTADTILTRGLHSTSDFPLILGDAVNREMRRSYQVAESGVRQLARQSSAKDFREKHSIALGDFSQLEKVREGGEFAHGTIDESAESYRLDTFGKIFSISRQAMINDDLGAFVSMPRKMGLASRAFEADFLFNMVKSNPQMADGIEVFHADHGNLSESATAITITALNLRRKAMRQQKSAGGIPISASPKFVLVGPELETQAEQLLTQITATNIEEVNPFGKLNLIVEPRIEGNEWYVVADPANIDGLEYAYLEGAAGPQMETRAGFEVDGIQVKIRLDFGAGWLDFRGWQKNDGA